jgi:hypothetical protein
MQGIANRIKSRFSVFILRTRTYIAPSLNVKWRGFLSYSATHGPEQAKKVRASSV